MIRRERAECRGERRAFLVRELLGMQLHADPLRRGGVEHAFALLAREADVLAERVHRIHQPLLDECRQDVAADLVDVIVGATGELRWQRVRREQGGGDVHAAHVRAGKLARDAQLFALVFQRKAISRLDLDGGHAFVHQRVEPGQRLGHQLLVGGDAGLSHCRHDAATLSGDGLVTHALQSLLEFMRAIAGVHQVRVAVDETGCDQPAPAVDGFGGFKVARRGVNGARVQDPAVGAGDEAIVDQSQAAVRGGAGHGGQPGISPDAITAHGVTLYKRMRRWNPRRIRQDFFAPARRFFPVDGPAMYASSGGMDASLASKRVRSLVAVKSA